MPSFEDAESDSEVFSSKTNSEDDEETLLPASVQSSESARGLSIIEKQTFLRDIDRAGGFENTVLNRIFAADPSVYGTDKYRQKKFRNLFDYWRAKSAEGAFLPIRSRLFPEHPPRVTSATPSSHKALEPKKSSSKKTASSKKQLFQESPVLSSKKPKAMSGSLDADVDALDFLSDDDDDRKLAAIAMLLLAQMLTHKHILYRSRSVHAQLDTPLA